MYTVRRSLLSLLFIGFALTGLACSDDDPAPGLLAEIADASSEECSGSGTRLTFGYDTTGDGLIDDDTSPRDGL